jgi:diacylglycerol kinase family enzyme
VIFNPAAGRGKARKLVDAYRSVVAPDAELRVSEGPGHAEELAARAAAEGFGRVVAAGGDGTVHEVANGLLAASNPAVVLGVWPLGSMNDYAFTLGLESWGKLADRPPLDVVEVDVGVAAAGGKTRRFVNCAGIGFNGMVTIEARKIRWLRGIPLYALGFLKAMAKHYATPGMTVDLGTGLAVSPTLALSVCLGQREGGFPLAAAARLDDGLFQYMHVSNLKRWQLVRYLPALITGNLPRDHPKMTMGSCGRVAVNSPMPLCIHLDGEFLCQPKDAVTAVTLDLLPRGLRVEAYRPAMYGKWK